MRGERGAGLGALRGRHQLSDAAAGATLVIARVGVRAGVGSRRHSSFVGLSTPRRPHQGGFPGAASGTVTRWSSGTLPAGPLRIGLRPGTLTGRFTASRGGRQHRPSSHDRRSSASSPRPWGFGPAASLTVSRRRWTASAPCPRSSAGPPPGTSPHRPRKRVRFRTSGSHPGGTVLRWRRGP